MIIFMMALNSNLTTSIVFLEFPMASTSSAPPLGNVASTTHQGMIASSVAAIDEHNTALATWNTSVVQGEYHTPSGCCDLKLWAYLCVSVSGTDIFHKY
jgi:hypothetical protein